MYSYVRQDDVLMPVLSVRETLHFYAKVRGVQDSNRIHDLLTAMHLEHVQHTTVGGFLPGGFECRGVSGGERRRLSIACGMIAKPSLLFLDGTLLASLSLLHHTLI